MNRDFARFSLPNAIGVIIVACVIALSLSRFDSFSPLFIVFVSIVFGVLISFGFFSIFAKLSRPLEADIIEPIEQQAPQSKKTNSKIAIMRFARAAMNAIENPIIILDKDLHYLVANRIAETRFGIKTHGARVETFLREPLIIEKLEEVLRDKQAQEFIWEHYFPNQRFDRVNISTFNYENELRIILIFVDETEMRKAEIMRVDFLANAGHELRTPLASIRGFLETLQSSAQGDADAQARFMPIMAREAERMHRLIEDIFSLSKIEFNAHVHPKDNLNLGDTIDFAVNSLSPILKGANRKLVIDNLAIGDAIGENYEIQQVANNLIENAVKYGFSDSEIKIEIIGPMTFDAVKAHALHKWQNSTSHILYMHENDGENSILVRVENFGKGIESKHMHRLSERFYRIDDESAHVRGTGLGLAIVKHIIKRHRGAFFVESLEGEKVAFSFSLPVTAKL